jgi:hypothetical protein
VAVSCMQCNGAGPALVATYTSEEDVTVRLIDHA